MIEQDIKTALQTLIDDNNLSDIASVYITGDPSSEDDPDNVIIIRLTSWIPTAYYGNQISSWDCDVEVNVLAENKQTRVDLANLVVQLDPSISDDIDRLQITTNSIITESDDNNAIIQLNQTVFFIQTNTNPFSSS